MVGRTAGDDHDPVYLREVEPYLGEVDAAVGIEAAEERRAEGGRLLMDLL
jgi:hypothetical protein